MGDDEIKYNKELCEERHKNLKAEIENLKSKMWQFVTIAIGALIGMLLNFIKDLIK